MDNKCLAVALFVKKINDPFDILIVVAQNPDHGRLLHCLLTSTIRYMEYLRSATDNVTTWNFLKLNWQ
jgi:hypothetical protein